MPAVPLPGNALCLSSGGYANQMNNLPAAYRLFHTVIYLLTMINRAG